MIDTPERCRELSEYYNVEFFDSITDAARASAAEILPLVFDLCRPGSVCDFGCARGAWLSVARQLGAKEVLGIDGPQALEAGLLVDKAEFRVHDFEAGVAVALDRRYDLGISLEVAEHIDEEFSNDFIDSLVRAAPYVLFSAAIPQQTGVNHVNEQWPSYWIRKFEAHDYYAYDCIRPMVWDNPRVEWWYAQNTFLFASSSLAFRLEHIAHAKRFSHSPFVNIVHPKRFGNGIYLR
jgi:hypothetical protein